MHMNRVTHLHYLYIPRLLSRVNCNISRRNGPVDWLLFHVKLWFIVFQLQWTFLAVITLHQRRFCIKRKEKQNKIKLKYLIAYVNL